MSSDIEWLRRDLTVNFGRDKALHAAFPDGVVIEVVDVDDTVPDVIAHHFQAAESR